MIAKLTALMAAVLVSLPAFGDDIPVPRPKPVPAEQAPQLGSCASYEEMERRLATQLGEMRLAIFHETVQGGVIIGVYLNPETETWSMIQPVGDGNVCVVNGGYAVQTGGE